MAVTVDDLKFFASERMTDSPDGGGRMTATEIASGAENQIFDDLSDVDRAAGDVSIRKVYAAVTSPDTAKYLDAGVVLFKGPDDPDVSVLAFSTGDFYDERAGLKDRLEQTVSRGSRWNGWLWGQHLTGQRTVTLWQRPEAEIPATGARMVLVSLSGGVETHSQYLWITRITEALRTRYEMQGTTLYEYAIREVVCEITEPLAEDYDGSEPTRADPLATTATALIYSTRYNAEAVPLFGIAALTAAAETGDFAISVDSLYSPVIPTAFAETALPDVTPGGDSPAIIAGADDAATFTTALQVVKPDASLYLGGACTPGTLSIAVSGATLTDDNGAIKLAGTVVGAINYGQGIASFTSACPNYGAATKTVTFRPAARPLRVADTASQMVTAENRGYVWVITLAPIPAPQTLRVSYRVNDAWYTLEDQGGGVLSGGNSSYGTGSLNFSTGTVTLTTGGLPDVDSEIIYAWATPVLYTARGGDAVDAPVVRGTLENAGVVPGTVAVEWTVGGTTYTLDDSPAADGALMGTGGTGAVDYGTGEWWVRPITVPAVGAEFTVDYQHADPADVVTETFEDPVVDGSGNYNLTLANTPEAGSVVLTWPVFTTYLDGDGFMGDGRLVGTRTYTARVQAVDDGAGGWRGKTGSLNYAGKSLVLYTAVTVQAPRSTWGMQALPDPSVPNRWNISYYRAGTEWVAKTAAPGGGDGSVIVKYFKAGAAQSASETVTLSRLELDLTRGYGETITAGSSRFRFGGSVYVDTAGQVYRDPSPETGAGTLAGSIDRSTGRVYLIDWVSGGANSVALDSLVTELSGHPIGGVVFRSPTSPLKPGTLQMRFTQMDGAVKSKNVGSSGILEDVDCIINVDWDRGTIKAQFGAWKVDADLTPEEKAQEWYDPDLIASIGGVDKIWKPAPVLADSVIYNAVAQTLLPPDSTLLGLDAARLPHDGKALVFNAGRLVLVHHTDSLAVSSLSPTQEIDCERVRLYRVVIEDSDGARLDPSQYSVNRETGIITMSPSLDTTGFTAPWTVYHTIADLSRLTAVDISGRLSLQRALSHDYPADDSRVSGVLFAGTLQARYTGLFAQSTWTGEWSDDRIGSEPLAQYNDTLYPVLVTNAGAYQDRFLIKFTSTTAFQVIGENLGLIATGATTENCAPVNPLTGDTYFTIDYRGWGAGWAAGNCLRFNLIAAAFPVDLVRAVQPSQPTGLRDDIEILLIGNVDA